MNLDKIMKNLEDKISPSELELFYSLKGMHSMDREACTKVVEYLKCGRVSQLIFDFGIDKLQYLSELLEDKEEYEILAVVRDKIAVHNKVTEKNYNIKK